MMAAVRTRNSRKPMVRERTREDSLCIMVRDIHGGASARLRERGWSTMATPEGGCYPMLTYYPISDGTAAGDRPGGTLWVDLVRPTAEEITRVETEFSTRVPSREQLDEIESSSRLRSEDQRLYLSMPVGAPHEQVDEAPSPLGFVVSPGLLITVRYRDLRSFIQVR